MLTKRTNILFEEEIFQHLVVLASKNGTSIGDLVRKAVIKTYPKKNIDKRVEAYNKILALRKNIKKNSTFLERFYFC